MRSAILRRVRLPGVPGAAAYHHSLDQFKDGDAEPHGDLLHGGQHAGCGSSRRAC